MIGFEQFALSDMNSSSPLWGAGGEAFAFGLPPFPEFVFVRVHLSASLKRALDSEVLRYSVPAVFAGSEPLPVALNNEPVLLQPAEKRRSTALADAQ
ncbi:hypothetical protein AEQ27_09975 [Frigoribacterium sp. RIT-PI-h]|nr:hypothetical protein AEQ27_09975 [Frigoribacterium sp. RIT-PI-h]